MDSWYQLYTPTEDPNDPNTSLYCKLDNCPKRIFTKTNRRRHLKRHHPSVYATIYDNEYEPKEPTIIKEPVIREPTIIKEQRENIDERVIQNSERFISHQFITEANQDMERYRLEQKRKQERLDALRNHLDKERIDDLREKVNQFKYNAPQDTSTGYKQKSDEAYKLKKKLDNEIKTHNDTSLNLEIITNKYENLKDEMRKKIKNGTKQEVKEVTKYIDNNKEALELMNASVSLCKQYKVVIDENVKELDKIKDEIIVYKDAIDKRIQTLETFKEKQELINNDIYNKLKSNDIEEIIKSRVKDEVELFMKDKLPNPDKPNQDKPKQTGGNIKKWEKDVKLWRGELTKESKKTLSTIFANSPIDTLKNYKIKLPAKETKQSRRKMLIMKELENYIKNF